MNLYEWKYFLLNCSQQEAFKPDVLKSQYNFSLFSKKQFEIWIDGEKNQILFQRSFVLIKKHFVSSTFCFLQWASSGRGSFPPLPGKIVLFLTSWEKSYFFNGFIQIYAFIITLPRKFFHPLKNSLLQPTSWSSQTSW